LKCDSTTSKSNQKVFACQGRGESGAVRFLPNQVNTVNLRLSLNVTDFWMNGETLLSLIVSAKFGIRPHLPNSVVISWDLPRDKMTGDCPLDALAMLHVDNCTVEQLGEVM